MCIAVQEIDCIINSAEYLKEVALNYTEFLMATVNLREQLTEQRLLDTFHDFDIQMKGLILFLTYVRR
jgi:Ca2+-binding EF-hand superfamily protein